jgi:mannose-6-phosphate isomerase-like protein (cupin superfamily)
MPSSIRRVVTGKDARGKAVVLFDAPAANIRKRKETGAAATLLWVTDSSPAAFCHDSDAATRKVGVPPPPGGTIFRVVEFAPLKDIQSSYETRLQIMREMGLAPEGSASDHPRDSGMHRTSTVDYAVIISGEIDMLLDDSEVHLTAGDIVVQQGTNHAWVNRADQPCKVAFILIDAKS